MPINVSARLGKHPIHPMLIVFPLGLWIFGLITYIIFLAGGQGAWDIAAWYAIAGGCIGAVLAAVAGFIDLLGMPPSSKSVRACSRRWSKKRMLSPSVSRGRTSASMS